MGILFNEAMRQRAIDTNFMNVAFNGNKKAFSHLEQLTKIHGAYTEGFYDEERKRFEGFIKHGIKR